MSAYDRTGADSSVNAANGYFSTPDTCTNDPASGANRGRGTNSRAAGHGHPGGLCAHAGHDRTGLD